MNPFTPDGSEQPSAGTAQVEAPRVLQLMAPETRNAHSAYVLGRGESFNVVRIDQRRRPGR